MQKHQRKKHSQEKIVISLKLGASYLYFGSSKPQNGLRTTPAFLL